MNLKVVMDWVRRHVFIVVFSVIILAAPLTGYLIGSSLKGGVVSGLNRKKVDLDGLASLENTTVTLNVPGRESVSVKTIVNRQVIDAYGQIIESLRKDADTVRAAALVHNSKNREVLLPEIFPKPSDERRIDAHERLYPILVKAYEKLLEGVRAGEPPPASVVRDQLQRRSAAFIAAVGGGKRARTELSPDDIKRLDDDLLKARKGIYAEVARVIGLYATADVIGLPPPPRNVPSSGMPLDRMFEWNWNLWIAEDVMRGLAAANAGFDDVMSAPVKRVLMLRVEPLPRGDKVNQPSAPAEEGAEATASGAAVDPKPEIAREFAGSFTGRQSNALYDVRRITLEIVAATSALPRIIDMLAKQNFITVTNTSLKPADPFAAARAGFLYGAEPVSEVAFTLEIIQLREWTTRRMPDEMKARIGTQGLIQSAGDASSEAGGV